MDKSSVGLGTLNNFDIYYTHKVKYMIDSICFLTNSQSNVQCPITFPQPPPPQSTPTTPQIVTVAEEWINSNYREIPGIPDFDKVIITCTGPRDANVKCLDQPERIIEIQSFAGFNCIANPTGCDLGKINVPCLSDFNRFFTDESCFLTSNLGGFVIYQPFKPDGSDLKSWGTGSIFPHVWLVQRIFDAPSPFFTPPIPGPEYKISCG